LPDEEPQKETVILGVSVDSIETQKKFKDAYNLPFELISDKEKKISKAYDTLGLMGLTSQRKTFIINPDGKIAYIFDKVKASSHDSEVKEILSKLMNS